MGKLYQPIREQDTVSNPRWLTPVFYRGYGGWTGHPATRLSWLPDPDWEAKLDRDTQWAMVFDKTCEMLAGSLRKGLAFLWYGEEGQGLDLFHQRLKIQLRNRLHQEVCLLEYRPHWPDDLGTTATSYDVYPSPVEMYRRAFQVRDLSDIGGQVRQAADPQCPKKVVYIRHQVLTPRQALNLQFLQDYLSWWDATLPHMLGPGQFGLLGISYQAGRGEDPEDFHDFVARQLELEDQPYQQIDCHVLFRLKHVDRRHLRRFIEQIGFPLPANRRDEILQEIWERSEQGLYEKIIAELQTWLRRAYGARA